MGDIIRLTPRVRSPRQRGEVDVELGREIATMLCLPKIISGCNGGAAQTRSEWLQ
jgi:hypothetical protein